LTAELGLECLSNALHLNGGEKVFQGAVCKLDHINVRSEKNAHYRISIVGMHDEAAFRPFNGLSEESIFDDHAGPKDLSWNSFSWLFC
jgi:hypothetical protein